jgi:hypothetical protein
MSLDQSKEVAADGGQNTQREVPERRKSVMHWLLDSDPLIRWQVMRDLMGESHEVIVGGRSRVAFEGWGFPAPRPLT